VEEPPDVGAVGLDLVLDDEPGPAVDEADPALDGRTGVRRAQVGHREDGVVAGLDPPERTARGRVLVGLPVGIDDERVVSLGALAVVPPPARAHVPVSGEAVVVGSQVGRPADATGVEDERADVEVAVVGPIVPGLEPEKGRVGVVPPRAGGDRAVPARELALAVEPVAFGIGTGVRIEPEDVQRVVALVPVGVGDGSETPYLVARVRRAIEVPGEPVKRGLPEPPLAVGVAEREVPPPPPAGEVMWMGNSPMAATPGRSRNPNPVPSAFVIEER
jgi:hypothetical protein